MKKLVLISGLFLSSIAFAQVSVPYNFNADTPISASEMNANFTALVAGVNNLLPAVGTAGDFLQTDGAGNYTWAGASAGGITSIGGQSGATQTLAVSATGSSLSWTSASDTHTLNIPMASTAAVSAGLISNTDYITFSSVTTKLNTTGGTIAGSLNIGGDLTFTNSLPLINFSTGSDAAIGTTDAYGLAIKTNNVARMTVNPTGDVGIGITAPTNRLHLHSTSTNVRAQFTLPGTGGLSTDGFTVGYNSGPGQAEVINQENTPLIFGTNNTEKMRIMPTGLVGIGTVTPAFTLHVVGDAGLTSGTSWTIASDARLKNVHGHYSRGLKEILKLQTVRYSYKKGNAMGLPSGIPTTGLIAQDVREVIPEAVKVNKKGFLELNVDPIHWAVVNGLKELYHKFIAQDDELAEFKRENDALKSYLCAKDPAAPFCHKR